MAVIGHAHQYPFHQIQELSPLSLVILILLELVASIGLRRASVGNIKADYTGSKDKQKRNIAPNQLIQCKIALLLQIKASLHCASPLRLRLEPAMDAHSYSINLVKKF